MPRCMNCGQRMLPSIPNIDEGTVAEGRSVLLQHEPDETQTIAARTGNHEPWWRTPDGAGAIPPPPQVKEEMARFQAREEAKASVLRAEEEAKEANLAHERKRAAAAVARAAKREQAAKAKEGTPVTAVGPVSATNATHLECARCGTVPPPGGGFSFCLSCGGDLSTTAGSSVLNGGAQSAASRTSAKTATTVRAASTLQSSAAPGVAGLRGLHQSESGKNGTAAFSMSSSSAQTGIKTNAAPPGVAALLSFFVPGVGQIINGQVAKGIVLLLASFVVTSVFGLSTMGILPLIGRVIAALDAYRVADRRRKGQAVRPDEWDLG